MKERTLAGAFSQVRSSALLRLLSRVEAASESLFNEAGFYT